MIQTQDGAETNDLSGEWHDAIEASAGLSALQDQDAVAPLRYGFRVGDIGFLLAQETLGEVAMDMAIHPMPHTKKWFAGMINMRGNLVPVFDVRMLLGIEADTGGKDKRRLLVLGSGEMAVSILIDDLPTTVNLDQPEDKIPQLSDVIAKYIGGAFYDQEQIWIELDIEAFFRHIGEMVSAGQCEQ